MGSLNLTPGSVIYIDADALIYSVERVPQYWPLLEPMWAASKRREVTIIGSELLAVEVLPKPLKDKNNLLVAAYEQILKSGEIELYQTTYPTLRAAAQLRAEHGLRTPDAIHAAMAMACRCTMFLTNDQGYRRLAHLPVVLLDEVLRTSP